MNYMAERHGTCLLGTPTACGASGKSRNLVRLCEPHPQTGVYTPVDKNGDFTSSKTACIHCNVYMGFVLTPVEGGTNAAAES
eukprot:1079337-Prymnesium_polylepis.2